MNSRNTMRIIDKIKKITMWVILGLMLALGVICIIQFNTNRNLKQNYATATTNVMSLLNDRNNEIIELRLSMDILKNTKDSTIQNLLIQKDKLNVKNNELQTMISMASQFHTHDTIPIHDTIFQKHDFVMDTCISDKWRTTCINMKYPNEVYVDVTMHSQKDVYVTAKRETVEPPHKFFICRWFQKKHTVTRIIINEENPYIESQENVYIRVVDD